jgi:hypothetical protein
MQQPHAAVHTIVLSNMKYIEPEDRSIYHKESILSSFQEMENESQTLFGLMDSLNKESEEYLMKQA